MPSRIRRLDDFGLTDVRFIKADVEGSEREVLDGAQTIIARDRPTLLLELLSGTYADPHAETAAICASFGYDAFIVQHREKIAAVAGDCRPRQEYVLGNRHRNAQRPVPAAVSWLQLRHATMPNARAVRRMS